MIKWKRGGGDEVEEGGGGLKPCTGVADRVKSDGVAIQGWLIRTHVTLRVLTILGTTKC